VLYSFGLIVLQMKEGWNVIDCTQRPPTDVGLLYLWGACYAQAHFTAPGIVVALSLTAVFR